MRKVILGLVLLTFGVIISVGLFAQPSAQPPAPPADKGTSGNQPPAQAPTGSPIEPGTGILLLMAAGYGIKKVWNVRKTENS